MALTKAHLVEHLFRVMGLSKREAENIIEIFFEEIKATLSQGKPVKLSGFGNFTPRDKKERPGRNPRTKKYVAIKKRRVVTFKAGQKLKARVERYVENNDDDKNIS